MSKMCIFHSTLQCTDCGDCDKCDLDKNKVCNNCGKCLDLDRDKKSILIDGIIEDQEEIKKIQEQGYDFDDEQNDGNAELLNDYDDDYVRDEKDDLPFDIELIDDIDGLREVIELDDEEERDKVIKERSPGFFVIKKQK
ncbi:hypothetical protein [Clostridium pasteurianum]|uniref:Uncharacterized protein n=1 Tax=Clostridium pasteurianum BC1 TaxID=86416 RepID=R4KAI5_CLOPA|nr:hypothetical protein [Clostridium pasteurianum]AGK97504.1 hypothetical protein Clopa_2649 [Clostridium pasteurianum BC1]